MLIINCLGCVDSGARIVAKRLAETYLADETAIFFVANHRNDFPLNRANLRIYVLKHSLWGRYLRPLYELLINLTLLFRFSRLHINLSHYGLCWFGKHRVYVHSPEIVSDNPQKGFSDGKINWFKTYCFKTCLTRAEKIFVQTQHMEQQVNKFYQANGLKSKCCLLIRPQIRPPENLYRKKKFDFQFFYPVSDFAHKRAELAEESALQLNKMASKVGLVITTTGTDEPGLAKVGKLPYNQAMSYLCSSDALLFTSSQETLGLPLLEALHYELPAVVPDLDYAHEIFGDAAVYFSGDSPRDVSTAMIELIEQYETYKIRAVKRKTFMNSTSISWQDHWHVFLE